jgi:hypothetical protein
VFRVLLDPKDACELFRLIIVFVLIFFFYTYTEHDAKMSFRVVLLGDKTPEGGVEFYLPGFAGVLPHRLY